MTPGNIQFKRLYRVKIEGVVVKAREIRVSESIDNLTTVAEFQLAGRPSSAPVEGDSVKIDWINPSAGVAYRLFEGTISSSDRESYPWSFRVRATDQLAKFRRARTTADLDLTGMTDGEAWQAIADACDIDYDPDDIGDTGYVLGALEDVVWPADHRTPASQVIRELDEVFGMMTLQIGSGDGVRVMRLALDFAPTSSIGLYKSYTNGVSVDFAGHRRARGDVDQIQNVWSVTGVSHELDNGCTLTPWAKADDGNELLGSQRVRVSEQSFSSDLIQSSPLAEAIVRRLMRRTNRVPDVHGATMFNDPNVHPGSKIRLVDPTYGLNTGSSGKLFLVRTVDRQDFMMTLDLEGGPGGSEGTVTSGAEKVCGDAGSAGSAPGDFTEPDGWWPILDGGFGDGFDFSDDFDIDDPPDTESPLADCTEDTSFDGTGDNVDQGVVSGSPSPTACPGFGESDSDWYFRDYNRSAGGGVARCKIVTPWYTPGSTLFRLDGSAITAVGQLSGNSTIYASTETDLDIQDFDNLLLLPVPNVASISGTVTFNREGSQLDIQFWNHDALSGLLVASGAALTIYSEPGTSVGDLGSIGLVMSTDHQGPLLIGDAPPNTSIDAGNRNNGGYVESSPAGIGVPVPFSFSVDENAKSGWGAAYVSSGIGGGRIGHLDYLAPATPLPGEPTTPSDTCPDDHADHVLIIKMTAGSAGTYDEMAVILEGVVLGHSTCIINPDYSDPGTSE